MDDDYDYDEPSVHGKRGASTYDFINSLGGGDDDDERPRVAPNSAADQLVPFVASVAGRDPNAVRPESVVIDGTQYYNIVGLWTLTYGHATQGLPAPVFDAETQTMVTQPLHFDY